MKKTTRTIVSVLEAHDTRKKRERAKVATKYFLIALPVGFIFGMIFRGFI